MSEYIVDVADADDAIYKRVFQKTPDYLLGYPVRERIVRCRDCAKVKGVLPDPETGETKPCCTMFGFLVGSEGFCAWGERK